MTYVGIVVGVVVAWFFFWNIGVYEACSKLHMLCHLKARVEASVPPSSPRMPAAPVAPLPHPSVNQQRVTHSGQRPMKGWMRTKDCAREGGIRTVNPHTGAPSCFIPD